MRGDRLFLTVLTCLLVVTSLADAAPIRPPSKTECEAFAEFGSCESSDQFMSQYCGQVCNDQLRRQRLEKFQPSIANSFFDLTATDIDGNKVDFLDFKGEVTVVVNVASECGE